MIRTRLQGDTPFFPNMLNNGNVEVCLKEDVDKVIAEKDEVIEEMEERIDELQKATDSAWSKVNAMYDELRHHKFKRCLAMARWCENAILGWMGYKESYSSHQQYIKVMLFTKWNKRWLELAEEPTWAKFLQIIHKEAK